MSCERQIERIQELVDGTLGAIRRSELEHHLAQCPDCRALRDDLTRIRDAAAALPPHAPPDGAWLQIAGRLRQEGRVRDLTAASAGHQRGARPYAWLAIAASLVLASGVSIFVLIRSTSAPVPGAAGTPAAGNAGGTPSVQAVQSEVDAAQEQFEKAITKMDDLRKANMQALDPQTSEVIEKNLGIIDHAIAENRAAVKAEPASVAARETLFEACLLYTSPSPRDRQKSRMPSSA